MGTQQLMEVEDGTKPIVHHAHIPHARTPELVAAPTRLLTSEFSLVLIGLLLVNLIGLTRLVVR